MLYVSLLVVWHVPYQRYNSRPLMSLGTSSYLLVDKRMFACPRL